MTIDLRTTRLELEQELKAILTYWQQYAPDPRGGFYGQVNYANQPLADAAKGIVLNSRILWTFAAAARYTQHDEYLPIAERAFQYLDQHFRDRQYGGVYWSVTATGEPLVTIKQLYGQAFAVYGLSEYYRITKKPAVLAFAREVYDAMVSHAYDPVKGGFREAFARDWSATDDYILSHSADHETKTMNTHLHVLEALASLLRVWPDAGLKAQVKGMLTLFLEHIVDPTTYRMNLFMDDNWQVRRTAISYGHDVEASWLLLEAAEILHDEPLIARIKKLSVNMARAARTGLGTDGGMNEELDTKTGHLKTERSWWVIAEAMVGFLNAYQLTHDKQFLAESLQSWTFIKEYLLDKKNGEWYMGVDANHHVTGDAKISMWKCPYHSARACMETSERLSL